MFENKMTKWKIKREWNYLILNVYIFENKKLNGFILFHKEVYNLNIRPKRKEKKKEITQAKIKEDEKTLTIQVVRIFRKCK